MKTTIFIILIVCAAIYIAVRTYQKPVTTDLSVFRDITDKHLAQPTKEEILKLYNLDADNKWNGAEFRFSNLTNVTYNNVSVLSLEPANKWLSNELTRDKQVNSFESGVSERLLNAQQDSTGKRNSSVYIPIAQELTRLNKSNAERRLLVVYSDLMENDTLLSFYNADDFDLLQTSPDTINKELEQLQSLPDLNGIEVHFIYQPTDEKSDLRFRVVSQFYKNLLEEKGAIVFIGANI